MNKYPSKIEKMYPRDYTVAGITGVFDKFVSQEGKDFFGDFFSEIVSVVENGQYYHGEGVGDRVEIPKLFLKKIDSGELDLDVLYTDFEKEIAEYERFTRQPPDNIELASIEVFYQYYRNLINVAYLAMDAIDMVEVLSKENQKYYKKWAVKARKRAERIYKDGENVFMPKYLEKLSSTLSGSYTPDLLQYLFFRELLDFIQDDKSLPDTDELRERHNFLYISQYPDGKYNLVSGAEAKKIIKERKLFQIDADLDAGEVHGQTAYRGKIQGKVSVIIGKKDFDKYEKGNILVTSMTEPSFLPLMKQAPAFVTDEGGTLSHAAIVAREMKKPCVIGTKYATKVFKDGDVVEVNADEGIVKRIENEN